MQGLVAKGTFRKVTRIGMSEIQMRYLSRGSRRMAPTRKKSLLTDVAPQASFSTQDLAGEVSKYLVTIKWQSRCNDCYCQLSDEVEYLDGSQRYQEKPVAHVHRYLSC